MVEVELVKHEWIKEYANLLIARYGYNRGKALSEAQDEYSKLQNSYQSFGYLDPEDWLQA